MYWKLSSLPQCFELSPADIERVESLGETEIFDFQTKPVVVDLKQLVSCFKTQSNRWLHLHPELVDVGDEGSAESGAEESAWFCHHCSAAAGNKQIPKMSIAAGIDYGLLSRVKELTPLTEMEKMLVSEVRLYHVVFKLASRFGEPGSESLKGDVIYFPQDGPAAAKYTFQLGGHYVADVREPDGSWWVCNDESVTQCTSVLDSGSIENTPYLLLFQPVVA